MSIKSKIGIIMVLSLIILTLFQSTILASTTINKNNDDCNTSNQFQNDINPSIKKTILVLDSLISIEFDNELDSSNTICSGLQIGSIFIYYRMHHEGSGIITITDMINDESEKYHFETGFSLLMIKFKPYRELNHYSDYWLGGHAGLIVGTYA